MRSSRVVGPGTIAATGRILFKIPLKTIADRRSRRAVPIVPVSSIDGGEFTADDLAVFRDLERRLTRSQFPR